LVDEDSASASEVLAGAMQDHDRALVVGESTFGKGLVQSVMDLPAGAGLTLTTARYFTPSGRSIQRDYSDGSLYAYFNERRQVENAKRPEAQTDSKRKVYGGDGITPDEVAHSPRYSRRQSELLDPTFFFAREVANGRLRLQTASASAGSPAEEKRIAADFETFLKADPSWGMAPDSVGPESRFIASRVGYYLALAKAGNAAANREDLKNDPALTRAIELLPRAADLAKAARRVQRASMTKPQK
jgi:carboxyl-terminal processing protease